MARSGIFVSRNFTLKTDRLISPAACREIGLELLVKVENRTLGGRDESQVGFTPYSAGYAREKGRFSPVDLRRSGDMLRDTDVLVADGHRIRLGFRSAAMDQRAYYHDSNGPRAKMPKRRFFGLQPSWVAEAFRRVRLALPPLGMRRRV